MFSGPGIEAKCKSMYVTGIAIIVNQNLTKIANRDERVLSRLTAALNL